MFVPETTCQIVSQYMQCNAREGEFTYKLWSLMVPSVRLPCRHRTGRFAVRLPEHGVRTSRYFGLEGH